MSYKIIDLPALGRPFNATDIIEVSANGTGSYKANIGNFTLGGPNYIFVNANGTQLENGQAVLDAYTLAQTLTPNGSPISATNRVTILLSPGYYSFDEATTGNAFNIYTSFIDFVSLTGQPDVYFSSISVFGSTIVGVDVTLVGIDTTRNNYYPHAAFAISSIGDAGSEYIVAKNCVGGDYSFSSFSRGLYGVYDNCRGGDYSFCSTGDGTAPDGIEDYSNGNLQNYGTIKNCTAGSYSFVSGINTIVPAGTVVNYNYIENCKSTGYYSFCYSEFRAQNSGVISNCESANEYSFCATLDAINTGSAINQGAIINCQGYGSGFALYGGSSISPLSARNLGLISGCYSTGTHAFVINDGILLGDNVGTILDCKAEGAGFCGAVGINSGIISNCIAMDSSFCSDVPASNSGQILRCTLLDWAFTVGTPSGTGRVVLGIDITGVVNF